MIYIFETDGSGGKGVSDLFKNTYGEDHFASLYSPYPTPLFLAYETLENLPTYFSRAKGICSNVCFNSQIFHKIFTKTILILRNPVSASICSYHNFLTHFARTDWPINKNSPLEYATLSEYLKNIRGPSCIVRALASVPDGTSVNQSHLKSAISSLSDFDHIVIVEELPLTILKLLVEYPDVRRFYADDQRSNLQAIQRSMDYDLMHVSINDIQVATELNSYDIELYQAAIKSVASTF